MNNFLTAFIFICILSSPVLSDQTAVLQPGGIVDQDNYDVLSWQTLHEPNMPVAFTTPMESAAVWFQPEAACSLIAIRFFSIDAVHKIYLDIWDGSHYDGHISTTDSTDENGWIGMYDPVTSTNWIPGPVMGHSPIGWSAEDSIHHLWELPFSINMYEHTHGAWYEVPAVWSYWGKVDLGSNPFIVSMAFFPNWGTYWAAEDVGTTPYHFFKYYSWGIGPDGIHTGWFLRRSSMWIEVVVQYYEPIAAPYIKIVEYDIDDDSSGGSEGNGDGIIDPGETIELSLRAANIGETLLEDAEIVLKTGSDYVTLSDSTANWGDIFPGDTTGVVNDFTFTLSPKFSVSPKLPFSIHITDRWGDSQHRFFDIPSTLIYDEEVLIVDDAGGTSNRRFVTDVLNDLGILYQFKNFDERFNTVFWFTGPHDVSPFLLYNLQAWLAGGGKNLFLSGQRIGVDVGESPFYTDYLSCQHVHTPTGLHHLKEIPGNPVFGEVDLDLFIDGDNAQAYASEIDPQSPAFPILEYDTTTPEGPGDIRSSGTAAMAIETDTYKAVYFAFGFEGIQSYVDRMNTMSGILKWFGDHETGIENNHIELSTVPETFKLFQNYPNPFNATTDIKYVISDNGSQLSFPVSLKIYNILGQVVRILVNEVQEPGHYTVTWDGRDTHGVTVPSGVYFCRLQTHGIRSTTKMVLLR